MKPFKCSCGKSYLHIQDLLDCYYSGHDQVNDVHAHANRLLEISGACRFTCAVFDDGYSSFSLHFSRGQEDMTAGSFQKLLEQVTNNSPTSQEPERALDPGIFRPRPALSQAGPASEEQAAE